jgi:hypothetical protein
VAENTVTGAACGRLQRSLWPCRFRFTGSSSNKPRPGRRKKQLLAAVGRVLACIRNRQESSDFFPSRAAANNTPESQAVLASYNVSASTLWQRVEQRDSTFMCTGRVEIGRLLQQEHADSRYEVACSWIPRGVCAMVLGVLFATNGMKNETLPCEGCVLIRGDRRRESACRRAAAQWREGTKGTWTVRHFSGVGGLVLRGGDAAVWHGLPFPAPCMHCIMRQFVLLDFASTL